MKNKIRSWLGIVDPPEQTDYTPQIRKIEDDLEVYKKALESYTEVECFTCSKQFITYPFGGGYYTSHNGAKYCSKQCLEGRSQDETKS